MAMLAEPRRKKHYVLQPRGKALYEDDDRFGSKMLQKMGWSKGKGLGAKESGNTDFVRVQFKSDVGGLGFEHRDDQWTQHEKGFNGLLETLQAGSGSNDSNDQEAEEDFGTVGFGFKKEKKEKRKLTENFSGQSLEEKSKRSKARVHYQKYTRGKDLSRYSEKDLANIFGKKADSVSIIENTENDEKETIAEESNTFQTSGNSIADYFKSKMNSKKNLMNGFVKEKTSMNFEYGNTENSQDCDTKADNTAEQNDSSEKSKKKKKKQKYNGEELNTVEEVKPKSSSTDIENSSTSIERTRKSTKNSSSSEIDQEIEIPPKKVRKTKNKDVADEENAISEKNQKKNKKQKVNDEESNFVHPESEHTKSKERKKTNLNNEIFTEIKEIEDTSENEVINAKNKKKEGKISDDRENNTDGCEKKTKLSTNKNSDENKSTVALKTTTQHENKSINIEILDKKEHTMRNFEEHNKIVITSFTAEKFRHFNFEKFPGSNLMSFFGYPFDSNMKLVIEESTNNEAKILGLWSGNLSKYKESDEKTKQEKTIPTEETKQNKIDNKKQDRNQQKNQNEEEKSTKRRKGFLKVQRRKRKNAFQFNI